MNKYTCSRCNGSGSYSFNLKDGTRCYGCNGTGKQKTKPIANPSVMFAVFGFDRATGESRRLYNVSAKSEAAAIVKASTIYARAGMEWKELNTLENARAIKFTDMRDESICSLEELEAV